MRVHVRSQSQRNVNTRALKYSLLPAVASSIIAFTSVYPFETLKARLQRCRDKIEIKTVVSRPIASLLHGYPEGVLGCALVTFLYFFVFTQLQEYFHVSVASAGASVGTAIVKIPKKVVQRVMQTEAFPNFVTTVRHIAKSNGLQGFYRGALPYLASDVPETCCRFFLFNHFSGIFPNTPLVVSILGGGLTALLMHPLDVVQTHLMCTGKLSKSVNYTRGLATSVFSNVMQSIVFLNMNHMLNLLAP